MKKNALWLKFILIGTELAFMILAGLFIGDKADKYFDSSPTFIIIGVVAGSICGFNLMLRILKKMVSKDGKN